MSDLRNALDRWDKWTDPPDEKDVSTFVLAARRVANPDWTAARWALMPNYPWPSGHMSNEEATEAQRKHIDELVGLVAAALGITEDE